MADYDSGLPIRSESDGSDERVHVKIVDGTTSPAVNQTEVDSDSNLHVEGHGNDPAGVDRVIRTSEQGHTAISGIYDVADNTDPSNIALIAHTRNGTPADTQSTERLTSIEDSGGTVRALDVSLHDENGEVYTVDNPLPVVATDSEGGTKIHDYKAAGSVAKDATDDHDYTVTAGKELRLKQILASASGKCKLELKIETGVGTGTYNTVVTKFNSTAEPNICFELVERIIIAAGVKVRVTMLNRDNQPQDLYSTIVGIEVTP